MTPYRLPRLLLLRAAASALLNRSRSFRQDALAARAGMPAPALLEGEECIPNHGAVLLTVNHLYHPGIGAWWTALAVAAALEREAHWVMTAALTYPGQARRLLLEPLSAWGLPHVARSYGFTAMPPMPPRPHEAAQRAAAVRQVIRYIRGAPEPLVALAPEGRDILSGQLGWPPPGAGRFILRISGLGLRIAPVGASVEDGRLCLRFGPAYDLLDPVILPSSGSMTDEGSMPSAEVDRRVSREVMARIAELLPAPMRGEFTLTNHKF